MANTNFLPKFEIGDNLSTDLRSIEKSKALASGWYKGQFEYHMRKANSIQMINGKEYYMPMLLDGDSYKFFIKDTVGYHKAEALRLFGFDDNALNELHKTYRNDGVKYIRQIWKAKHELNATLFRRYVNSLRLKIANVDTIEIEYELERFDATCYPNESDRPYTGKIELYGNKLSENAKSDGYGNQDWTNYIGTMSFPKKEKKSIGKLLGSNIKFYSGTTDISETLEGSLKLTIQSMIAYSGTEFLNRLSSIKTGERITKISRGLYNSGTGVTTKDYISVIGKETYSARILNNFLNDEDETQFNRYKASAGGGTSIDEIMFYTSYASDFWTYSGYKPIVSSRTGALIMIDSTTVDKEDTFLFVERNDPEYGALMSVEEFKKLSMKDVQYYVGKYLDFYVREKETRGFMSFVGGLMRFLGTIFDVAFNIFYSLPIFRQMLQLETWIVNKIFNSSLTEKEFFKIELQIEVAVALILSGAGFLAGLGISLISSLAIAGSDANDKQKKEEANQERKSIQDKEIQKQKEKQQKEDEMKQKMKNGNDEYTMNQNKFENFLKNPLYEFDMKIKNMKVNIDKQFKLI